MRCVWVRDNGGAWQCPRCGTVVGSVAGLEPKWDAMPDCAPVELRPCAHREIADGLPYCRLAQEISETAVACPTTARWCEMCAAEELQQINRVTVSLAIGHAKRHGDPGRVRERYGNYLCRTPRGLGDLVEAALRQVGITKDRVERWLGRPCGCAERQQKLNALGDWARRAMGKTDRVADELEEMLGE